MTSLGIVGDDPRPLFQIDPDANIELIGEECSALLLDSDPRICQHEGHLMKRLTFDGRPYLKRLKIIHVRMEISTVARFEKWDGRRNRYFATDPPASVAAVVLKMFHYFPEYKEPEESGGAA
jgi:hypothetical protein